MRATFISLFRRSLTQPAPSEDSERASPSGEEYTRALLFRHAVLDTKNRTSVSTTLYLFLWLVVSGGGGLWQTWPGLVALHAAGLLLIGVIRFFIHRELSGLLERSPLYANALLCLIVLANGLYWGCLAASSVVSPWGATVWWAMLIVSFALASVGSAVMSMNIVLRFSFPAAMLLPLCYCAITQPSDRNFMLVGLILLVFLYVSFATNATRKDYRDAILARLATESEARQLQHLSRTDALTGGANRLAFDTRLKIEWAAAKRSGVALSLLMVDLDHFKAINDTYGHPFGDECLKAAARALENSVRRQGDTVFRYGGEEFAILLVATDIDGAAVVAQRCLEQTRELRLGRDERPVTVTCSVGMAIMRPQQSGEALNLVQEADNALYRAKREGRDRAVWANTAQAAPTPFH